MGVPATGKTRALCHDCRPIEHELESLAWLVCPHDNNPSRRLRVRQDCWRYAGFNLILVDRDSAWSVDNKTKLGALHLPHGLYGLGNVTLDTPNTKVGSNAGGSFWPALTRARAKPSKDNSTMPYSQ